MTLHSATQMRCVCVCVCEEGVHLAEGAQGLFDHQQ